MKIISNLELKSNSKENNIKRPKPETATKSSDNTFFSLLEAIVPSEQDETRELNELLKKLPRFEKEFIESPTQDNLNQYKKLVKDITQSVIDNNMKLSVAKFRGRNDKKILTTVKIIDENLHLLTLTMLNPKNSAFNLLKQMEKIRGLLMDIQN